MYILLMVIVFQLQLYIICTTLCINNVIAGTNVRNFHESFRKWYVLGLVEVESVSRIESKRLYIAEKSEKSRFESIRFVKSR